MTCQFFFAMSRPIRREPAQNRHIPRKRFGQNFLTDRNILNKIVEAAEVGPLDIVLEIGPGRGHLTRALAGTSARVVAVEVDRDLYRHLETEFADFSNVNLVQGDILAKAPRQWLAEAKLAPPYLVVANIPYYITSAILRYLLEAETPPQRIVVMVQKQVAQQIVARPPHGNLLGTSIQFYGQPKVVMNVPAGAFYPRPAVDSAVVLIDVDAPGGTGDAKQFFRVVRAGFGSKRKQLRNALMTGLHLSSAEAAALLHRAGIDPARRAETLSLDEWKHLAGQGI
jgi:16S rRNA (adenine1518-N6/adenine1519-N6)-dimethyltransferase